MHRVNEKLEIIYISANYISNFSGIPVENMLKLSSVIYFPGGIPDMQDHSLLINWQPKYNLGIPIIDEQHRGIVSIINSLYYGMQNKNVKGLMGPIIDMLQNYTKIHFQIEESFFTKSDYPDIKPHLDLHQDLISRLAEIRRKSMLDKDPYQLMDFMKQWWTNHICKADMQYRDYLA